MNSKWVRLRLPCNCWNFHHILDEFISLIGRCDGVHLLIQIFLLIFDDKFVALHYCGAIIKGTILDNVLTKLWKIDGISVKSIQLKKKISNRLIHTTDVNGKMLVTNRWILCLTRTIAIRVWSLQYLHFNPNRIEAAPKSP